MCCKGFWSGTVVFSIVFLLSLFLVRLETLLLPVEIPNVKPVKIEPKECVSDNEVFNKYKNYSVERLEKEYIDNLLNSSAANEQIVIRNEKTQDLTIEETKILRRKIKEEFPRSKTQKVYVLMMLIKYKRGEIKEHPFYNGNCVEN